MPKISFFADGPANSPAYVNVRDLANEPARRARADCEALWEVFEPYADREFLIEIRDNFDARYWEMYLTVYLIQTGFKVSCPKPGPDVGIEFDGRRIWFEATSPSRGADGAADRVPEIKFPAPGEQPVAQRVPNEQMVLRYLNSISEKYERQYPGWLKRGIVSSDDAFVIAINPRSLGHEYADTQPPRILQAAFAVGNPYVVIYTKTHKQVDSGYQFRTEILKASGTPVTTGVFQYAEFSSLSALLCSRIDVANQPAEMGDDFQLVPNPNAKVCLPAGFRLGGTYFRVQQLEDGYSVTAE